MLRATSTFAGGILLSELVPWNVLASPQQPSAAPVDPVAKYRADAATMPVETLKLRDNMYLLSGPGGNIVVLNGPDGKLLVDTFVSTGWTKLKQTLDGLSNAPLKVVIDTHWHLDHADNNGPLHDAGATVLAHENTRKRLSTPQDVTALGMHFPASPTNALPQLVFKDSFQLFLNNEDVALGYIPPAHTDTDIYIHFQNANVLHLGDTFFNGHYPFIDASTAGNINGMITATERALKLATSDMKIVPGHGPLGDKPSLTKWYDMISAVRDRVQKQKADGRTLPEVVNAKPTAEFDPVWGNGFIKPDFFVTLVYSTL
jgi:glyoxylase-like metal-dependent hydrolase (beta-lactamase superfamily II)